ncbi:MAG: formylglycine-generating enzyme family protein [Microcoleus sp. PH2017_29_MFU_D_A]|uniref:formylglycine-generating enzyme family protein n=1 Tax=unclassified Microcoleus TaxID=2642155 RepID=UPI001DB78804|nr:MULTISPECIES: formylglycine-generating enzyme family protein [unclassified Microcoleus]MCC3416795.1 formylglycine-generating enzyme family protein [Microcoleus sp. PH2017_07_MST_O_A]MCC3464457.1 formylglycine-generating enzyme family protein [Microcoleus sp. PH2017_06_SFM_O_A]MCC3509819.1 formylglycine-generating enzyme family protein [Microcoleus sp. PH2017_17_BER_D_A]TAE57958.1 MAG: formylglycine-generating enzyme family protein [Oscillatoriales cyanobacterium]MCC3425807.1 formylglycine-g
MPNEQNQPGEYDAVLGGQNSTPVDAAVLGGITGVKSRLASPAVEVRIAALSEALQYGEAGLDLLLQGLNDKSLQVKFAVYNLLKDRDESKIKWQLNNFFYTFNFDVITVDHYSGNENSRCVKSAQVFNEDLGDKLALQMVYIPGGKFEMGASHLGSEQKPSHQVTIQPVFMAEYTVNQAQWERVMKSNPSHFKGAKRPVEQVSWDEAIEFCDRLTQKTGNSYRLPSEAEWEYACRAGTNTDFYFGSTITTDLVNTSFDVPYTSSFPAFEGLDTDYAFIHRSNQTTNNGKFYPNSFGLYDMHGNVWEWCSDCYHSNYNGAPSDGSSWEIGGSENQRMLRGGSWDSDSSKCSSLYRYSLSRDSRRNDIGFRVVIDLV